MGESRSFESLENIHSVVNDEIIKFRDTDEISEKTMQSDMDSEQFAGTNKLSNFFNMSSTVFYPE